MKPGDNLGPYIIQKEIGRGGMGVVFLAVHQQDKQKVALKMIKPDDSQSSVSMSVERLRRFEREIQTTRQLNHPHIVAISEVDLEHEPPYVAMEYLAGGSLRQRLKQPLSWQQTLTLLRPLTQALTHVHRVGIFHRDLKPGNVMFADDSNHSLKLVDFGLAYQAGTTRITMPGSLVGTLAYLAPEQARGDAVDSRADIFALGIIMIEAITGLNPLERETGYLTFNQVVSEHPVDISSLQGRIPQNVIELISQATAKDRDQRYATCELLLADLDRCLGKSLSAPSTFMPKTVTTPEIRVAANIELSDEVKAVLRLMFKDEQSINVEAEFGRNFSGSRVFRVRSSTAGRQALPSVVKVAPIGLIEQEWLAYNSQVANRLVSIAEIAPPPNLPDNAEWDGLRYKLFGGGAFKFSNLSDYCLHPDTGIHKIEHLLQKHLFKVLYFYWWRHNQIQPLLWLQADYDDVLPVNLMLTPTTEPAPQNTPIIEPERMPPPAVDIGDLVQIKDFAVTEIDYGPPEVTLNLPDAKTVDSFSYRIRLTGLTDLKNYRVNLRPNQILARVSDTRHTTLLKKANEAFEGRLDLSGERLVLPNGLDLPNPLTEYQKILASSREVRVGTIHGDLNMENILVDEKDDLRLIDFATVRSGHILHDLLRLETDIVIKLVPKALQADHLPAETICTVYRQLHQIMGQIYAVQVADNLPHPNLKKSIHKLLIIRTMARECLVQRDEWAEYYEGLTLYLLGSLKFREPALAKQVLVLGAAMAVALIHGQPVDKKGGNYSMFETEKGMQKDTEDVTGHQDSPSVKHIEVVGDRNVIGDINIGGPVSGNIAIGGDINQSSEQHKSNDKLISTARKMLGIRNYQKALDISRQMLAQEPDHGQANLIAAIALMQNRNASDLNDNTIDQIEEHLDFARSDPMTEITALAVLGVVKHDHYLANDVFEGSPTFAEIVETLRATGLQSLDQRLFKYVKASPSALKQLGLRS